MPFAGHVGERRLPARAYPQVSWDNDGHRPIIHRLQPRPQRDIRCGTSVADHRRPPWLWGRKDLPLGAPDDPAKHHHQEPAG